MAVRTDAPKSGSVRALERIRANLPQMPAAAQRIAEVVLAEPSTVIELSITELAERAGASAATVTRFCRTVGYSGYPQLRVGLAAELGGGDPRDAWKLDISREFGPDDSADHTLRSLLAMHTRSLQETASLVDLELLESVAAAIAGCRQLDVYAVGGSAAMAGELHGRLYRIGVNVHTWSEPHGGLVSAVLQDARSVAIAISASGRTVEVVDMIAQARAAGAVTLAITSARDSPLARAAEFGVITAAPNQYVQPGDLSARPSQLLVLDLIYLLVARQDVTATATRLAASRLAVSGHRRSAPERVESAASATASATLDDPAVLDDPALLPIPALGGAPA